MEIFLQQLAKVATRPQTECLAAPFHVGSKTRPRGKRNFFIKLQQSYSNLLPAILKTVNSSESNLSGTQFPRFTTSTKVQILTQKAKTVNSSKSNLLYPR